MTTSIGLVTRQIAALEISSSSTSSRKTQTTAAPGARAATHLTKQPSQTNVSKLMKKFANPQIDIGKYDGGFEVDNEVRGEKVYGEAAEDLALDSSVSQ
jgi:hypothetical protein